MVLLILILFGFQKRSGFIARNLCNLLPVVAGLYTLQSTMQSIPYILYNLLPVVAGLYTM
jgi:hypothetical protein